MYSMAVCFVYYESFFRLGVSLLVGPVTHVAVSYNHFALRG